MNIPNLLPNDSWCEYQKKQPTKNDIFYKALRFYPKQVLNQTKRMASYTRLQVYWQPINVSIIPGGGGGGWQSFLTAVGLQGCKTLRFALERTPLPGQGRGWMGAQHCSGIKVESSDGAHRAQRPETPSSLSCLSEISPFKASRVKG